MERNELKERVLKKFKKKIINNISILSVDGREVNFRFRGFSGVYNISMKNTQMPAWFKAWNESEFRPLVKKVDKNTDAINKNTYAIEQLSKRMDNIVVKNNLEE